MSAKKFRFRKGRPILRSLLALWIFALTYHFSNRYFRIPSTENPSSSVTAKMIFSGESHQVLPQFLSVAVDMSQWLGYKWWGPSGKSEFIIGGDNPPPLNLNDAQLMPLFSELKPFYVRLGGSLSDEVEWNFNSVDDHRPGVIQSSHRKDLQRFLESYQAGLIFNISSNPRHWTGLEPDFKYYSGIFAWLKSLSPNLVAVEFGNESGIHPLLYKTPPFFKIYGERLSVLKKQNADLSALWIGPGNPYWAHYGEWFSFLFSPTKNYLSGAGSELDVASFHYYPTQSTRCGLRISPAEEKYFLNSRHLNEFLNVVLDMKELLAASENPKAKNLPLWLSESGPAQCGGQKGFSDRFISSLWWIDELGLAARNNVQLVIRQSLLGGDYGLIDEKTLKPRPDFWTSVLWKKTMGERVLKVDLTGNSLRAYAHCQNSNALGIALINLESIPQSVEVPENDFLSYEISAESLQSENILVNGQIVSDSIPKAAVWKSNQVSMKPRSILFLKTTSASKLCLQAAPVKN